ncbi:MAG: S46 family peptidase [Chrysiogenales bacterium]|nr:MAG: S46 family peptidase [Chrysiogenales bacterium]
MRSKAIIILILFSALSLTAKEGMFRLDGITAGLTADMKAMGCQFDPADIWQPGKKCLAMAVVRLGGGSGAFVSADGLIITNHHVAFGAVQSLSSPQHNYIRDGFLASDRSEEIPAPGYNVRIMSGFENVTFRFQAALRPGLNPQKRLRLIEKISQELIRDGEKIPGNECSVARFYSGREFYLVTYFKIRDMRVVYVPARSIGAYGGEIDNWMWPRHSGDFSFLRAYVGQDGRPADWAKDNVPYRPLHHFPVAKTGLRSGDFTMILGYPGTSKRWCTAAEIGSQVQANYPERIALLAQYIELLEKCSTANEAVKIKNAGMLQGLYNSIKNNRGLLAGLQRNQVFEFKLAKEKQLAAFIAAKPTLQKKFAGLLGDIESLNTAEREIISLNTIYSWLTRGCRLLNWALTLKKWSHEKTKKDLYRERGFMERDMAVKKERMQVSQKNLDLATDQAILSFFLDKLLAADSAGAFKSLSKEIQHAAGKGRREKIAAFVDALYSNTRLADLDFKLKMFAADARTLAATQDAFISLAGKIQPDIDAFNRRKNIIEGSWLRLKPLYIEAMMGLDPQALYYPDANSTLRFSYGRVEGYTPRDAVRYAPFSTLSGMFAKNSGKFPFDLDAKMVTAINGPGRARYNDPFLGDVPVNFLTSNDSTGGNSGSPVLNERAELVGVLFDGNYEALDSDFYYQPDLSRSIHVDIRYVLFVADRVNQAVNVLAELGAH